MFVDLLYKMSLIYYYTFYLQKNDFWHYVYVKFNTFSVKYIFEKNAILSYKLLFTQIRFSRVILTIHIAGEGFPG